MVGRGFGVGQPARIGRPVEAHIAAFDIGPTDVGGLDFPVVHLHDAHAHVVVYEGDVFGIGRPDGFPGHFGYTDTDAGRLLEAILAGDHEAISVAAFVGEPGDAGTVGRPGGGAVGVARAAGQVAGVAVFHGHGEDFAAGFQGDPFSGRGEGNRSYPAVDILPARFGPGEIP